jgi:hypothetical protein
VQPVAGKKYLLYVGQEPDIHPELPRLQVNITVAQGEQLPTERVLTASFGTNSGAAVGKVKLVAEHLGVSSPLYKGNVELKIRTASLVKLQAEETARQLADSQLSTRVTAIEAKGFSKGSVTVGAELGHIDLDKQYSTLFTVSVGRAVVHEGEDFTVSVVSGKTRLTWINSLANPNGEEKIETGDKVFFVGSF